MKICRREFFSSVSGHQDPSFWMHARRSIGPDRSCECCHASLLVHFGRSGRYVGPAQSQALKIGHFFKIGYFCETRAFFENGAFLLIFLFIIFFRSF